MTFTERAGVEKSPIFFSCSLNSIFLALAPAELDRYEKFWSSCSKHTQKDGQTCSGHLLLGGIATQVSALKSTRLAGGVFDCPQGNVFKTNYVPNACQIMIVDWPIVLSAFGHNAHGALMGILPMTLNLRKTLNVRILFDANTGSQKTIPNRRNANKNSSMKRRQFPVSSFYCSFIR